MSEVSLDGLDWTDEEGSSKRKRQTSVESSAGDSVDDLS